jgi:transposase
MYPFYLGIDLHLKRTYVVLIDDEGEIIDQRRLLNTDMPEYLKQHVPQETFAVLEATRNWPFMYDLLGDHVHRVELAHPKEVKAIANAAVKTDRIDAGVLAHLARLNYLPTAYAAPKEYRDLRLYTRHRSWLIKHRTQAKNRVQAVLAGYNLVSPVRDLFGANGREFLQEVTEDLRPAAQWVIADNLALIDLLNDRIKCLERNIPLTEEQKESIKLLKSIPGIGKVTAMAILAEIGQISRFKSAKSLCNWAGLTPRVRKSDAIVRHGKISKQGSAYLRSAMGQAAMVASRFSPRWYRVHERLVKTCGKRGAKVAVARRLLTVIYHMLKKSETYQEDYPGEPGKLQGAQT